MGGNLRNSKFLVRLEINLHFQTWAAVAKFDPGLMVLGNGLHEAQAQTMAVGAAAQIAAIKMPEDLVFLMVGDALTVIAYGHTKALRR